MSDIESAKDHLNALRFCVLCDPTPIVVHELLDKLEEALCDETPNTKFKAGDLVVTKRKAVFNIQSSFIQNNKVHYIARQCGCDFGIGVHLLESNLKKIGVAI